MPRRLLGAMVRLVEITGLKKEKENAFLLLKNVRGCAGQIRKLQAIWAAAVTVPMDGLGQREHLACERRALIGYCPAGVHK